MPGGDLQEYGSVTVQVAGVILEREGRILLQHRDDRPDIVYPGCWAVFGGHVEPGEEPEAAAIREIEEELGLRLQAPLPLAYHGEHAGRERFFFAAELPVPPDALTLREGQGMGLFAPEELDGINLVPIHREILRGYLADRLKVQG